MPMPRARSVETPAITPTPVPSSPADDGELRPYWQTTDGEFARLYLGDVTGVLARLPEKSVHCAVTSPPYWGLRSYLDSAHSDKAIEIGSEPSPDCMTWGRAQCGKCHVCVMVGVMRGVKRVLRDDGTLWMNYGDTYSSGNCGGESVFANGRTDGKPGDGGIERTKQVREMMKTRGSSGQKSGLPAGNLVGVPWRVALAMQADGWILRSDIPWVKRCLSGGSIVYARTQKGEMPTMMKDLVRLDPSTVQLWNGRRWTQVLGFHETKPTVTGEERRAASVRRRTNKNITGDLEIEFRNGERVACTREHQWPTDRGVLRADELEVGDKVPSVKLPQPDEPLSPSVLNDEETGWVIGFYLAEGHIQRGDYVTFTVHAKERETVFPRIKAIAESLGDTCSFRSRTGNTASIHVAGRLFVALMSEYVSGETCYVKRLTTKTWRRSDQFLRAVLQGYLDGDGHYDTLNDRWRLGFCNNDGMASDLRTLAARTDCRIRLKRASHKLNDQRFPGWRGELRFAIPCSDPSQGQIVAIRAARSRTFWDVEVEDDPHLFALASGLLTHNSAMPESANNRPNKALEYVFLFAKKLGYYFDMAAIRRTASGKWNENGFRPEAVSGEWVNNNSYDNNAKGVPGKGGPKTEGDATSRNFRNADLWFESVDPPHGMTGIGDEIVGMDVTSQAYSGAHFACVDDQTEALTMQGWRRHTHLNDGELIASYDLQTDKLLWAPATFHRYDYDGELVVFDKRDTSQWLTPNHRCLVKSRKGFVKIRAAETIKGADKLLMTAEFGEEPISFSIGEDFAALVGWYASEGHKGRKDGHAFISQSMTANPVNVQTIAHILQRLGAQHEWKHRYSDRYDGRERHEIVFKVTGKVGRKLRTLCPNKMVTNELTRLPKNELRSLLQAFIWGDGHTRPDDGRECIIQKDRKHLSRLQVIAIKLGYRAHLSQRSNDGMHVLYLTKGKWLDTRGTNGEWQGVQKKPYKGVVWCPSVSSGLWLARREGKPFITGNTFGSNLITPFILSGTSEHGCCADCGAPWKRVAKQVSDDSERQARGKALTSPRNDGSTWNENGGRGFMPVTVSTLGWRPSCECHGKIVKRRVVVSRAKGEVPTGWAVGTDDHTAAGHNTEAGRAKAAAVIPASYKGKTGAGRVNGDGGVPNNPQGGQRGGLTGGRYAPPGQPAHSNARELTEEITETVEEYVSDLPLEDHPVAPCTILDPFIGSGTSIAVANAHGRRGWGIDLSEKYLRENAVPRISGGLLSRPDTVGMVPGKEVKRVEFNGKKGKRSGD